MPNRIISDNWSLQNITELLTKGLGHDDSAYIKIDRAKDNHAYTKVLTAIIQTEALFDFLTDIVLRDQIIIDERYENAWKPFNSPLLKLSESRVIRSFAFLDDWKKLEEPREEIVKRLCITSSIKNDHQKNASEWGKTKSTPYSYLSQILWGGAGMLARAYVYEKSYTPHPVRKRFFLDTELFLHENAATNLVNLIKTKRTTIASAYRSKDELHSLKINMPPIPIQVIRESNSPSDLITVALQMREEYSELRDWLRLYQKALTDGTYRSAIKYQKLLNSISSYIDCLLGSESNTSTYTAGIGVLKIAVKGQPINAIKNQFGVRSMINKLILSESGESDMRKYLGFFDHKNSAIGMKITENFSNR